MSVWLTIPSARPPAEANPLLQQWRDMGYKIALWRDDVETPPWNIVGAGHPADLVTGGVYRGYANAVNSLIAMVMKDNRDAEWFVAAGDDTLPDPTQRADRIAEMCRLHFCRETYNRRVPPNEWIEHPDAELMASMSSTYAATFGVMQPTGDRWHEGLGGFANAPIDRVAGSAWIGREFARGAYGGNGPLWPGYTHMYVDEELQCVAEKLGVFWQRRELVQRHQHWGRGATDRAVVNDPQIPPHLVKWNTPEHWNKSKALFMERKAAGFPGHEVR